MSINIPWNPSLAARLQANTNTLVSGGAKRPQPPESIVAQPGPNSVLLGWPQNCQ